MTDKSRLEAKAARLEQQIERMENRLDWLYAVQDRIESQLGGVAQEEDPFRVQMTLYKQAKQAGDEEGMRKAEHQVIAMGGSLLQAGRHVLATDEIIANNLKHFYKRTGTTAEDYQ